MQGADCQVNEHFKGHEDWIWLNLEISILIVTIL